MSVSNNAITLMAQKIVVLEREKKVLRDKLETEKRANWELTGLLCSQATKFNATVVDLQNKLVAACNMHLKVKQCETRPYILLDAEAFSRLESEKIAALKTRLKQADDRSTKDLEFAEKQEVEINDLARERDHLQKQLADITLVYAMVPDGTCVCYDRGAHETVKGLERKLKAAIDARTSQHRISLDLLERVKGLRKQLKKRPEVRGTECYFRRHQIFLGATHDGVGDHLHRRQFEKWFATEAALIGVFQSG